MNADPIAGQAVPARGEPETRAQPEEAVEQPVGVVPDAGLAPVDGAGTISGSGDGLAGPTDGVDGEDRGAPALTPLQRVLRVVIEWVVVGVCALGLALLLKAYLVEVFEIPSGSMEPTLMIDDRVVVHKLGYRFHDVNRGDVVVFRRPGETPHAEDLIKRVVAVGGETLEIRGGSVHIDGEKLDEPYLAHVDSTYPKTPIPGCVGAAEPDRCEVPDGKILVFGDNREESRDGRYFGPVDVDTVVGRAFMKLWPPSRVGAL